MEIREIIRARGFTVTWLAQEIGMSRDCLSNKLFGRRRFKPGELERLAAALEVHKTVLRRATPEHRPNN